MKKAVKGSRIFIIDQDDPLFGATAIVTQALPLGVSVVLLTIPEGVTQWSAGDPELFQSGYVVWNPLETPWDFVERYYYKYHNCQLIADSDDLQKILDNELEPDSCSLATLNSEYGGARELNLERIKDDLAKIMVQIYEASIEAFVEIHKL